MNQEKILFIINPISGTRFKGHLPELIRLNIDKSRFDPEIVVTKYKGEATEYVNQYRHKNFRFFVAVGGDGTVNEVAKGLLQTDGVLGIIPVGSGNGLARHLKIPLDPLKAIKLINSYPIQTIDSGSINGFPFFCTCGIGFDALIGYRFAQTKRRGFWNYLKITLKEYLSFQPEDYKITLNNSFTIEKKAFLITVANGSQYGNNAYIAPKANIADGFLDLCLLHPFPLVVAPLIGIRLFSKKLDRSAYLFTKSIEKVTIERVNEAPIHFDGEPIWQGKKIEITIIPQSLKVISPIKD